MIVGICTPSCRTRRHAALILGCVLFSPVAAVADVVLDWNAIAAATVNSQSPFAQARFMAITQLAVFEAVNAVTGEFDPYLGTVVAPVGASADAAAAAAAHAVLRNYFPGNAAALDTALVTSLAAIPDGPAETNGVATGAAAAAAMIALRANDGSSPPAFFAPGPLAPGEWQPTPTCTASGGGFFHWQNVTPFGLDSVADFLSGPPPALTSNTYAKDYVEVKMVGSQASTERPQDRTVVAQFYAGASPSFVINSAARQIAIAKTRSTSENAQALALINMAINDSLVASFFTKYHYTLWRPETAIHAGDVDQNSKTVPDTTYAPLIPTPCFPSYPSNHAAGSNAGAEMLRRLYGAAGHAITLAHPVSGVTISYTSLEQITDDVDDARVYGGIHFRFDQVAGGQLGREIATAIYKANLQRLEGAQ